MQMNRYTGFTDAAWGRKTMGGQCLLIVLMVASGQLFSRLPSRRWIGLIMAVWIMKKTTVVAHLALVL